MDDPTIQALKDAGYRRRPRRRPEWVSAEDWERSKALPWQKLPIHHLRLNEATIRGLKLLAEAWGTRTYGRTIARAVEECLRA